MLSGLVYKSDRKENCSRNEIESILSTCQESNKRRRITGVLLYSNTTFIQYLEGDFKEVISLYNKIKTDHRHKNAAILGITPINHRIFPGWQMGSKEFDPKKIKFETDLHIGEPQTLYQVLNSKRAAGNKAIDVVKNFFATN